VSPREESAREATPEERRKKVDSFQRHRLWAGRLGGALAGAAVLFTQPAWKQEDLPAFLLRLCGGLLVAAGVTGRIWCLAHVFRRKNRELVTAGPYSMCRHPLYLFSFMLGVGAFALLQNPPVMLVFMLAFLIVHLRAALKEEQRLAQCFGAEYEAYRAAVPRFLPAPWLLRRASQDSEKSPLERDRLAWALFGNLLFLLLFPAAELIRWLHAQSWMPALWRYHWPC
jgi:protein-S-isoprenylcysteine O-methyltransferase Ste14